ncbi:MAG: 30S ribosomal protein S2 [Gemmatimonadaceae bacterium]
MAQPSLDDLLKAGVHFGHQTRRWNPKMRRFIFAERNGIHIIDLQKTLRQIELAQKLAREVVLRGDQVLYVCTKRQLSAIVMAEAERAGALSVTERWLGGLLTNFATVKKQIRRLKELEAGAESGGGFENYTKKEALMLTRQKDKLLKNLSGIKNMGRLPGLMFVIDAKKERIAVDEANKLGIPIIAICDTNSDPDLITVPIAGNDDAIRAVELLSSAVTDAIIEARREAPVREESEDGESYTYSSDRGAEPEDGRRRGGGGAGGDRGGRGGAGGGGGADRPRRRRAKPDAIAARLKGDAEPAAAAAAPAAAPAAPAAPAAEPAVDAPSA